MPLSDAEILDRRDVEVHLLWSNQVVARAVAVLSGSRVAKRREIEIRVGSRILENRIHLRAVDPVAAGHNDVPAESQEVVSASR